MKVNCPSLRELAHGHGCLTSFKALKFLRGNQERAQERKSGEGYCDGKRGLEPDHVGLQYTWEHIRRKDVTKLGGTRGDDQSRVDAWSCFRESGNQPVDEGRLAC